jgi:hypothetical protein
MKTTAWLNDTLLQHRTAVQKAVKCEVNGNQTKADEHYDREKAIRGEIVAAFDGWQEAIEQNVALRKQLDDVWAESMGVE